MIPGSDTTPSGQVVRSEEAQRVTEALGRLPEDHRLVLLWRNWEQLSFAEIGQRLARSEDAARMLYTRALARLQCELESEHEQP